MRAVACLAAASTGAPSLATEHDEPHPVILGLSCDAIETRVRLPPFGIVDIAPDAACGPVAFSPLPQHGHLDAVGDNFVYRNDGTNGEDATQFYCFGTGSACRSGGTIVFLVGRPTSTLGEMSSALLAHLQVTDRP